MLVKANITTDDYNRITKDQTYVVLGCEFALNPEAHNRMNYFVKIADHNRKRLIVLPVDAQNFTLLDSSIPSEWLSITFDDKNELVKVMDRLHIEEHQDEVRRYAEYLKKLEGKPYMTHLVSFPEMMNYDFYIAVHDDNMEEEEHVVRQYVEKYEKHYASSPLLDDRSFE